MFKFKKLALNVLGIRCFDCPNKGLRSKTRAAKCGWSEAWERRSAATDWPSRNETQAASAAQQLPFVMRWFYFIGISKTPPFSFLILAKW